MLVPVHTHILGPSRKLHQTANQLSFSEVQVVLEIEEDFVSTLHVLEVKEVLDWRWLILK